jgi:2-hydroxy-6-oxonona-2,4-dienedioate hydrolase
MSIWTELLGMEIKQTYYDAGGVMTRAVEAGDGPPLLLLHGTGGHAEAYARNMAAHAEHFHVYAIDMVGHGYTDKPDVGFYIPDFASHVLAFIDAIGAKKVSISGESLGAMVGAWIAAEHPDRVERLVMNTGMLMPLDDRQSMIDVLERSRQATGGLTLESVRKRMEWLMYDVKNVPDEIVDVRYKIYSEPGMLDVMSRVSESVLAGVVDDDYTAKWLNPEKMRDIQCPVLILWGKHNPGQTLECAQEGMTYIKDARLVVMQESAHWPQWEEADVFNKAHIAFLRGE